MKHICPYCGFDFDDTHEYCTSTCPLGEHCTMLMCPNCRYEYVPMKSGIVEFFKRLFSPHKSAPYSEDAHETHE